MLALALGGAAVAAPRLLRRAPAPEAEPHPTLQGFRRVVFGRVTPRGEAAALAGVGPPPGAREVALRAAIRADPRDALFGPVPRGALPVAIFLDAFCPLCPALEARLDRIAARRGDLHVVRHDAPMLGEPSRLAARAAIAAEEQGAGEAMRRRLLGGRAVPEAAHLAVVSAELGLDAERLLRDAASAETDEALARADALVAVLGLPGTPATVIGRTLVIGSPDERATARLIEEERSAGRHLARRG